MKILKSLLCLLCLLTIHGCSSSSITPSQELEVSELTLFLTRRSLSGTDFEQYKLGAEGNLFVECGKISGGRFTPTFQKMDKLHSENRENLNNAISRMVNATNYKKKSFDNPGKNSSLFDPGKYKITFSATGTSSPVSGDVFTSLDSITEPTSPAEKELFNIATAIRTGVSFYDPICNNREFFGVPGRAYPEHG